MLNEHRAALAERFAAAARELARESGAEASTLPVATLERPKLAEHGDLACNLAMQLARPLKMQPRRIAERLVELVQAADAAAAMPMIAAMEIAGPGFINLRLRDALHFAVLPHVLERGETFGRGGRGLGRRVVVEFVSANPTGPLHVGHGRQGALGDALAALLDADGWSVSREFYYNDAGAQIDNLALSVQARARGLGTDHASFPADGYRGDYIADIAADYLAGATVSSERVPAVTAAANPDDLDAIRRFAVACLRREQDLDLRSFGVRFDTYFLESSLYEDGRVDRTVAALQKSGHAFEQDGALWLRTTDFGDDKDRVMRKSAGGYTYFVPDVAYHVTKWERGFARAINVQGSDHHGTTARVRAGLQALDVGIPAAYPEYVLHKMVTVMRGGQEVKISKRAGSYVTLRDLISWSGEVRDDSSAGTAASSAHEPPSSPAAGPRIDEQRGRDAVRFFLLSRKADSEFVFDVDLAVSRSDENPVYYVQYAHARLCSVLAQWGGDAGALADAVVRDAVDLTPLSSPRERELIARLAAFPDTVAEAVDALGPHTIAFYLKDLAAEIHSYYNAERFLVDDEAVRNARLALVLAARQVLRNGLALIGVSAPERM